MITFISNNKYVKIDLKRLFTIIITIIIFILCVSLVISFCRYPEKYQTIRRYNLQMDIKNGDPEAINYYNKNYVENGVYLYGENPENDILDLNTITTFEASENGVLLITNDGSGYFIEK